MNKTKKLILIKGTFSEDEAKEILTTIFLSKINFHNIKNWSSQERFRKNDKFSEKRIPALRNEMEKLQKILLEAKAKNKRLAVISEINISLVDD